MKYLAVVLLTTLFFSIPLSKMSGNTNYKQCLLFVKSSENIPDAEVCAWGFAKQRTTLQFPQLSKLIERIEQPDRVFYTKYPIKLRDALCYGFVKSSDMSIHIWLSGSLEEDIDTLTHEYSHYIAMSLAKTEMIEGVDFIEFQYWVDSTRHWAVANN